MGVLAQAIDAVGMEAAAEIAQGGEAEALDDELARADQHADPAGVDEREEVRQARPEVERLDVEGLLVGLDDDACSSG